MHQQFPGGEAKPQLPGNHFQTQMSVIPAHGGQIRDCPLTATAMVGYPARLCSLGSLPVGKSPVPLSIRHILWCTEAETPWKFCLPSAEECWLLFMQAVTVLASQLRFQHDFRGDTDVQTRAIPYKLNIDSIWPSNSTFRYTRIKSSHSNKFLYR